MKGRLFAPEVIQTSAMDCGPAALKCLLDGHGRPVSYGRLREACQTDVDGTSIDTLEDIAVALGLDAAQVMVPADHVVTPEAELLPALAVWRQPNGLTHFVVIWGSLGGGRLWQLMDPATGRRWMTRARLLRDLYRHRMVVPVDDWREWAASELLPPLRAQLADAGVSAARAATLIEKALADPGWKPIAALDAAARMTRPLVAAGAIDAAAGARLVEAAAAAPATIPDACWSARDKDGELQIEGAVLVRVSGLAKETPAAGGDLRRALEEPPPRPWQRVWQAVIADGALPLVLLALALPALVVANLGTEVLLRAILDAGRTLQQGGQRLGAMAALVGFATCALLLELGATQLGLRAGRRLEARLRLALLEKLPRTADRYFRTRLVSDLAERAHHLMHLRQLPLFASRLALPALGVLLTTLGLALLAPAVTPLAVAGALVALIVPALAYPVLVERELRARTIGGTLSRALLDALLGLTVVRAHRAERVVRRQHEALLVEQTRALMDLLRAGITSESLLALVGTLLAVTMVWNHTAELVESGAVLLFVYWALAQPTLGSELAALGRQVPSMRNVTLRLLEPLSAPEEEEVAAAAAAPAQGAAGVDIVLEGVTVSSGGMTLLSDVSLRLSPGSQTAVVGVSGAGKSTLASTLLGLHRPAEGTLTVDGAPLDAPALERLRRETVWVDPAVQLWNRSLYDNLAYGNGGAAPEVVSQAELGALMDRLPDGLQTPLGEGGSLVSGGEGQRVRLGRALGRARPRLVILDEPFRGLDRAARHRLLARARDQFGEATLLIITHDVGDTVIFDRVLVIEDGKLIEDGAPFELAGRAGSRFRALLDADEALRASAWGQGWRRLRLERGRIV